MAASGTTIDGSTPADLVPQPRPERDHSVDVPLDCDADHRPLRDCRRSTHRTWRRLNRVHLLGRAATLAGGTPPRRDHLPGAYEVLSFRLDHGMDIGARRAVAKGQERQMIGPDRRQHAQLLQPENGREEDVIERPAQKSPIGVEGRVEAAADAGIEETADLLEQAGRAGQGNVVQVARDDRRLGA